MHLPRTPTINSGSISIRSLGGGVELSKETSVAEVESVRYPDPPEYALYDQPCHQVPPGTVPADHDPVTSPAQLRPVLETPEVGVEHLLHCPGVGVLGGQTVLDGDDWQVQLLAPLVKIIRRKSMTLLTLHAL